MLSGPTKDLLTGTSLVVFLISSAFLLTLSATHALSGLRKTVRPALKRRGLMGRIRRLSVDARAVVSVMAMRNQQRISLTFDFPAAAELRRANLLVLDKNLGSAGQFKLDFDVHFAFQRNLSMVDDLEVTKEAIQRVEESERRASELTRNAWMGN